MALEYSAGEIFEIAQQMERNGALFYRRAAEAHRAIGEVLAKTSAADVTEAPGRVDRTRSDHG